MPLRFQKKIADSTDILVWELTENENEIIEHISSRGAWENIRPIFNLNGFSSNSRRVEWLTTRLLLEHIQKGLSCLVTYDAIGKPHVPHPEYSLSITHTKNMVAVAYSSSEKIGIDIEYLSGRIRRIAKKFIHPNEENNILSKQEIESMYILWCAKETIYKSYGKTYVSFKRDISVTLPKRIDENGIFTAKLFNPEYKDSVSNYKLYYMFFDNYILVWTI